MGRVTFNGSVATKESQVYIQQEVNKILAGPGDEFLKARRLDQFYAEQGIQGLNMRRAGDDDLQYDQTSSSNSIGGSIMGKLFGFIVLLIGVWLMGRWGF